MAKNARESAETHAIPANAVWRYVEFPIDVRDVVELLETGDKTGGCVSGSVLLEQPFLGETCGETCAVILVWEHQCLDEDEPSVGWNGVTALFL